MLRCVLEVSSSLSSVWICFGSKFHASSNYSFIIFMSSCRHWRGSAKTDTTSPSLQPYSKELCMWICGIWRLWFHDMEHWNQTMKRFAMRDILRLSFFHSLMQQILLNESTILDIPVFASLARRSLRTCAPLSWNSWVDVECAYGTMSTAYFIALFSDGERRSARR